MHGYIYIYVSTCLFSFLSIYLSIYLSISRSLYIYMQGARGWYLGLENPHRHERRIEVPRRNALDSAEGGLAQLRVQGGVRGESCLRAQSSGFSLQGSGFRVRGSGFRVEGSWLKVEGSWLRVQGPSSRVQGSRFRVRG